MLLDLDLFAGPGGWDVAATRLGMDPYGIEWDETACATGRAAGFHRYQADVSSVDPWAFVTIHGGTGVRGLIGSPPCGPFSVAGAGKGRLGQATILDGVTRIAAGADPFEVIKTVDELLDDVRAAFVLEPLRWALDLEPEWIALEQVPPVLPLWDAMADVLHRDGYSVDTGVLSAEQYDVPQTRKRAFLVASKTHQVTLPAPTRRKYKNGLDKREGDPTLKPWMSMADALGWGMTAKPSMTVTAGGAFTGGAEPFGNQARRGILKEAREGRYRFKSGTAEEILPGHARITPVEAAVLQGFPADHPWEGNKGQRFRQIGDAVPPPLAWHVLRAAMGLDLAPWAG